MHRIIRSEGPRLHERVKLFLIHRCSPIVVETLGKTIERFARNLISMPRHCSKGGLEEIWRDNGLLAPELAAGIHRVKIAKSIGVRAGNWLSLKQVHSHARQPIISLPTFMARAGIVRSAAPKAQIVALTMPALFRRASKAVRELPRMQVDV
jgi:hypothetical protein